MRTKKQRLKEYSRFIVVVGLLVFGSASTVMANSTSPNYQIIETQFGGGSTSTSCSGLYCAQVTLGDVSDGQQISTASFGDVVDGEPVLEVIIDPGESNLGILTTERTATKTTNVRVRSHLSNGYALQIMGAAPKFGEHTLRALDRPTASKAGDEQFGINLVANNNPSVGRNPIQLPEGASPIGVVADQYGTPNLFQYVEEDVVASSRVASGRTDYTISMIVNISNATPPGDYSGDLAAILVPFY